MATPVTLPALGESVTEGTVTRWLKQVGDSVEVDEPLLEVSTDKVDTEIPSPVAGTVLEIKVDEDETVAVGAELAVVGDSAEQGGADSQPGGDDTQQDGGEAKQTAGDGQQADSDGQQSTSETPAGVNEGAAEDPTAESTQESQPTEQPPTDAPATAGTKDAGAAGGTAVTLPALGESVTEGTVTRWLKQVGDSVEVDEPLLEVSTDKVDTEIPSPVAGTVLELKVGEDETVAVGAELAVVGDSSDKAETQSAPAPQEAPATEPSEPQEQQRPATPEPEQQAAQPPPSSPQPEATPAEAAGAQQTLERSEAPARQQADRSTSPQERSDGQATSYVTPIVRKLASQHGVDLATLTGTGVGGRIRKQDVLAAEPKREEPQPQAQPAEAPAPAPAAEVSPLRGTTVKLSRLRKTIAARMVESLQVSAQLTTVVEVDVTGIARLRDRVKGQFEQREGVKLSFLPFFAKAAIDSLKAYPMVNASVDTDAGTVTYHGAEHLGVAVDTERGLLVPVIKDAGDLSIPGLARKIADLAARTRDSKITPDELSGGTFTLTNTGSRGALFDTPIINQPQVAILGTGSVVKRAVVIDDPNLGETIAVRRMVFLALTYDHRIVDGADAARFLSAMKQRLEAADFEAELGL